MADDPIESSQNSEPISEAKARSLANLKPFQPGQSGNPGGRPKKTPITDLYQEILNDPANMETFKQAVIKAVNSGRMSSMFQLKEMAERVEGKVTQSLEVKTELRDMTEAELQAKLDLLRKELA